MAQKPFESLDLSSKYIIHDVPIYCHNHPTEEDGMNACVKEIEAELQAFDLDDYALGTGDMTKAVYDTDDDGIVDGAEQLNDSTNTVTAAEARSHLDNTSIHGDSAQITDGSNTVTASEARSHLDNTSIHEAIPADTMFKADYDTDDNGIVDAAEQLNDGSNVVKTSAVISPFDLVDQETLEYAGSGSPTADVLRDRVVALSATGTLSLPYMGYDKPVMIVDKTGAGITITAQTGELLKIGSTTQQSMSNSSPAPGDYVRLLPFQNDLYWLVLDTKGTWS